MLVLVDVKPTIQANPDWMGFLCRLWHIVTAHRFGEIISLVRYCTYRLPNPGPMFFKQLLQVMTDNPD